MSPNAGGAGRNEDRSAGDLERSDPTKPASIAAILQPNAFGLRSAIHQTATVKAGTKTIGILSARLTGKAGISTCARLLRGSRSKSRVTSAPAAQMPHEHAAEQCMLRILETSAASFGGPSFATTIAPGQKLIVLQVRNKIAKAASANARKLKSAGLRLGLRLTGVVIV
ncbi:hypothetical protein BSZ22_17770 [Bradyrhizobium canariense]|uniref:Uncharacterized protein n=1 Tax=Bradyrhizobium canariense TaxID=255045 RepID=A0A1X3GMU5_9BRAD|nr:hypothetical protein BSZ22_17770 [Bradyrhizobium canariense]OSI78296.1 hypothetical protein BSZ23_19105 [Bradyrhizobium canariense]OSI90200.1 hypothetical protein BSZ25_18395 [Bradyrhizobium canariense]OSI93549.1 hypothetical protein BSZ24_12680 [Bradyrhizobium canariense]OSJ03526.1 hypothetical protein BSZ16_15655 [Bradyrhizobium canariense]